MGGWIKVEKSLKDDPRVMRMASRLRNADVTLGSHASVIVIGALVQFWWYADTHIRDDDTLDLGKDEIDQLVGVPGFCDLMPDDWLRVIDDSTVELPGFQTHNGVEAKRRALGAKRTSRYRDKSNASSVTPASPDQTKTRPIPRPEKSKRSRASARPSRRCPTDFEISDDMRAWAAEHFPAVNVEAETAAMRDHEYRSGKSDWPAAWRSWIRKAAEYNGAGRQTTKDGRRLTRYEEIMQELHHED